jgi:hypothetical protein
MEAWRLKMGSWWVYRPEVADSHQFDEEQEQDPYYRVYGFVYGSVLKLKSWIRIRI